MKSKAWIGIAACIIAATMATAGPIIVEIDGVAQTTTYNNNDDISINVGTFSGLKRVRIYDSTLDLNGLPDETIGKVTIDGTPSGTYARMDFWISRNTAFPTQPNQPIVDRGARSFGVNGSDGLEITNEALRRRTRVAIAVLQDIRGNITAGQIFRIQNGIVSNDTALFSGEVSANITAVTKDQDWRAQPNDPPLVFKSIEEINTIGLLSGTIVASDPIGYEPGNPTTYSNIGRVIARGTTCTFPTYGDSFPDRR